MMLPISFVKIIVRSNMMIDIRFIKNIVRSMKMIIETRSMKFIHTFSTIKYIVMAI